MPKTIDDALQEGMDYLQQMESRDKNCYQYLYELMQGRPKNVSGRLFFKINFSGMPPRDPVLPNDENYSTADIDAIIMGLVVKRRETDKTPDFDGLINLIYRQIADSPNWQALSQKKFLADDSQNKYLLDQIMNAYCYRIITSCVTNVRNHLKENNMLDREAASLLDKIVLPGNIKLDEILKANVNHGGFVRVPLPEKAPASPEEIEQSRSLKTTLQRELSLCRAHYAKTPSTEKAKLILSRLDLIERSMGKINFDKGIAANNLALTQLYSDLDKLNKKVKAEHPPSFLYLLFMRRESTMVDTFNNIDKFWKDQNIDGKLKGNELSAPVGVKSRK